jgi:hypothetical protein
VGASCLILYHFYEFNPIALNITAPATPGPVDTAEKSREQLDALKEELQAMVSKQPSLKFMPTNCRWYRGQAPDRER